MGSIDRSDSTPQLLNRLRMRQVALLLAIDELRTLRAASAHLGMTQPAGSKMLQELEDALGLPLFERANNGLHINPAGQRVVEYFRHLHGSMEALNRELHEMRQGSLGRLAVGSIMAASPGRLTQALLALKHRWPLLSIEIAVDTSDLLLAQLEQGVLEVVLGRPPQPTVVPGNQVPLSFCPIHGETLAVIAACEHPLATAAGLTLGDLREFGWILQPAGSPMRTLIEQEFASLHLRLPHGLIETGSMLTTMSLVRQSRLIAVLPQVVAQDYAAHGMIVVLDCALQRSLSVYGSLVRQDRPLSQVAREFLALIHG